MNALVKSLWRIPVSRGLPSGSIVLAAWSFSTTNLHGQNTITNFISAVASYQFYDAFSDLNTNSLITSPVATYQFYDAFSDLTTNSLIMSPVTSLQFFDWPSSVMVPQLDSPTASYYYQPTAPYLQLAQANQGEFEITLWEGATPSSYSLQFSTNLVNWQPVTNVTITTPNVGLQIYAAASNNGAGFYRAVAQ